MKRYNLADVIIFLTFIVFMIFVDISHIRWMEWAVLGVYSIWAFLIGLKTVAILKQSKKEY